MIVYIHRGVTRLALRVKEFGDYSQMTDWKNIQLVIRPGQHDRYGCFEWSPWFLRGCWPYKRTGVDVAAPHFHDFPVMHYKAFELDADGRIVFRLDSKFQKLPAGRYTGELRVVPKKRPHNVRPPHHPPPKRPEKGVLVPPEYLIGQQNCVPHFPEPPRAPHHPPVCILAVFDIDLGPSCSDHLIDQAVVEFALSDCEEINGET